MDLFRNASTSGGPYARSRAARRLASGSRLSFLLGCALCLCIVLVACEGPSLLVLLDADLEVPSQANRVTLEVSGGGTETSLEFTLEGAPRKLSESLLLRAGTKMRDEVEIQAKAWNGAVLRAQGTATARFAEVRRAQVEIHLSLSGDDAGPSQDGGSDAGLPTHDDAGNDAGTSPGATDGGSAFDAGDGEGRDAGPVSCLDEDEDGYGVGPDCIWLDCDDTRSDVHPGAEETCNGVDDNCDLAVDEGCPCLLSDPNEACGLSVGACFQGEQYCDYAGDPNEGRRSRCVGARAPERERCGDYIDSDCDGDLSNGC